MDIASLQITFAPLMPVPALAAMGAGAAALCAVAILRRAKGSWTRVLALALLLASLANPVLVAEKREPLKDTVILVTDESASMRTGDRDKQAERVKSSLLNALAQQPDLELETVAVNGSDKTGLFEALAPRLAAIPPNRLAGIVAITDGQIHDAQEGNLSAPFHALIAGSRNEKNRKLILKSAPSFAVVGKEANFTLRIEDSPRALGKTASVFLRQSGQAQDIVYHVPIGTDYRISVPVRQAGANLFAFEAEQAAGEISTLDNRSAVSVNGVRDRLRALLVSGTPHIAARVWRGLLKSDPAIDLLHFTILRTPFSSSHVPQNEMSLIAFPTRELFEEKLSGFDVVIFDRFSDQSLVPEPYLENIARYVRDGGALLISHATEDESSRTRELSELYVAKPEGQEKISPLSQVLPLKTSGKIVSGNFTPTITREGLRHPVTDTLTENQPNGKWSPWHRQVETENVEPFAHAQILMTGLEGRPLLVLDRVGKGRVAQFLSDQFWLWSRGGGNEGPQIPLMRKTVHWLMQEPELDETALRATAQSSPEGKGWTITATKRSLDKESESVTIEKPKGQQVALVLSKKSDASTGSGSASTISSTNADKGSKNQGLLSGSIDVEEPGIYRIRESAKEGESNNPRETLVMAGAIDSPEYADLMSSDKILKPYVQASGGGVMWLEDLPDGPKIQRVGPNSSQSGWGWIGLRRNGQYRVTGSESTPLGPLWAILAAILAVSMLAWRREGR